MFFFAASIACYLLFFSGCRKGKVLTETTHHLLLFLGSCVLHYVILVHVLDEVVLSVFDEFAISILVIPQNEHLTRYSSFESACIFWLSVPFAYLTPWTTSVSLTMSGTNFTTRINDTTYTIHGRV